MNKPKETPDSPEPAELPHSATREQAGTVVHHTLEERAALGKMARSKIPRKGHAAWDPPAERSDPVALLEEQGKNRIPELLPIRYGRMLASPFAFYRGAAAIMASDLSHTPNTGLNVQLCGDAHLGNFGGFASPERNLVFDINDFDETLPGPWEWDVKRLAASFEIAGRERGFKMRKRRAAVLAAVGEYRQTMVEFAGMPYMEVWYSLLDEARIVARWGRQAKPKTRKKFTRRFARALTRDNVRAFEKLTQRVDDGQLRIVNNPPLVVPIEHLWEDSKSQAIATWMHSLIQKYRHSLQGNLRHLLEKYQFVDMARKVVGVGSVGTRAWIVLLQGHDDQDALFLQAKEAQESVLEPYLCRNLYANHGQRVVEGQRLMQAASDIFLGWQRTEDTLDNVPRDFYVRQLMDWKISLNIKNMNPKELSLYGRMCGWTLARAHARSGDSVAISAYLGKKDVFDQALADFAAGYADQNESDYQELVTAEKSGQIVAEQGV